MPVAQIDAGNQGGSNGGSVNVAPAVLAELRCIKHVAPGWVTVQKKKKKKKTYWSVPHSDDEMTWTLAAPASALFSRHFFEIFLSHM
jgi:hypothetical protein